MPYFPASNINAANYNPNDVPTVDTYDYSAQAKAQTQATLQEQKFEHMQSMAGLAGSSGHSNMARSSAGSTALDISLQERAESTRAQSDQLKSRLSDLEHLLFEPVLTQGLDCGELKDNPSTVEGNTRHTFHSLASAIVTLERILAKIGGR